jgi:hypothetical protein
MTWRPGVITRPGKTVPGAVPLPATPIFPPFLAPNCLKGVGSGLSAPPNRKLAGRVYTAAVAAVAVVAVAQLSSALRRLAAAATATAVGESAGVLALVAAVVVLPQMSIAAVSTAAADSSSASSAVHCERITSASDAPAGQQRLLMKPSLLSSGRGLFSELLLSVLLLAAVLSLLLFILELLLPPAAAAATAAAAVEPPADERRPCTTPAVALVLCVECTLLALALESMLDVRVCRTALPFAGDAAALGEVIEF